MNPELKKKLSNERRLQALKLWKKNRTAQEIRNVKRVSPQITDLTVSGDKSDKSKLKLFDSDNEDEKYENCFDIRPQFEGEKGQQLLEMSSQFTDRFKLDERFKDEEEPCMIAGENEEKAKNFKILESVLGHEVCGKLPEGKTKKRQVRFDPEDENASKYIKTSESSVEQSKRKARLKKKNEDNVTNDEIPISSERYIEVSTNLKDILSSSSEPFSLSQNFISKENLEDPAHITEDIHSFSTTDLTKPQSNFTKSLQSNMGDEAILEKPIKTFFEPNIKDEPFFISKGDSRLKEGIKFFMRPKSLEEIREDWQKIREEVLEIFRRKKRSSQRRNSNKVQIVQTKYNLRRK